MKKLLSVLLVLVLCGFASATFNIYITDTQGASEITVVPSSTTTLYVWYTGVSEFDGTLMQMFDLEATVTGPGTILDGAITATNRNTVYDGVFMPGRIVPDRIVGDIELMGGRDDRGALTAGLANPLATISFHCETPGQVLITLADVCTIDQDWNVTTPLRYGMVIHQIPEPATLLLLGLGAFAIASRRSP